MPDVHTLYTITFSHFCEAARWALQASNIKFTEVGTLPGLHMLLLPKRPGLPAGSSPHSTPFVKTSDGEFVNSSWAVLEWAGRGTVPQDIKDCLDKEVGPATRSIFYSESLRHPCFDKYVRQSTWTQRVLWSVAGWKIKEAIQGMMVKDEEYIAQQQATLERCWGELQGKLMEEGDGNPFTDCPDGRPNASTIALCSIAGALLLPEQYSGGAFTPLTLEDLPSGQRGLVEHYRATPMGKFILQMYKDKRM